MDNWLSQAGEELNLHLNTIPTVWQKLSVVKKFEVVEV